ncbi:MAG: PD40 domain-containing protein [Bacteroidetes bacterium]|nr:PD40 domain-containing protein [Bacteroidota bacterium]
MSAIWVFPPDLLSQPRTDTLNRILENLGTPVNTEFFEYAPHITADESMLIFTYRGKKSKGGLQNQYGNPDPNGHYFEDIMVSFRNSGRWSEPRSISDSINTNMHDACIALSPDGQKLLVYRDNIGRSSGDIYISELDSNEWQKPKKIKNINTNFWEGSATLSADMKTIYFCSDRRGGLGGRDIYMSNLSAGGEWEEPVNMGEVVNSNKDEDSPFIHPDGVTLYFSSKGHNTKGGYDIFISHLQLDTAAITGKSSFLWSNPENIGEPVNTPGDDRFYVVSADGKAAYFSSERTDGLGLSDIYMIRLEEKHILLLVKGKVFANDRPAEADIIVAHSESEIQDMNNKYELRGRYKSNSASGKYMMVFNNAGIYSAAFEVRGFPKATEYFPFSRQDTFVEIYRDVDLYSPDYISPYATIDGIISVKSDSAKIFPGINVFLKNNSGTVSEQAVTDKNGYFIIRKIPKEEQYFISLSTRKDAIISGDVISAGKPYKGMKLNDTETRDNGSYRLEIKGMHFLNIEGEVTYANRSDESQFIPVFLVGDDGLSRQTMTDGHGHFKFDGLPDGRKYSISVSSDSNLTVKGVVKSGDDLMDGISVNEELTDKMGRFDFQVKGNKEFECSGFFAEMTGWNKVDFTDEKSYNEFLIKFGNISADGLVFKVQIGAYRNPNNFNYDVFGDLGKINSQLLKDGLTRFTIGEFKTINEAEYLKRKARQRGKKDAFITYYCRGERKLLSETIGDNFRKKQ